MYAELSVEASAAELITPARARAGSVDRPAAGAHA